MVDSFVKTAIPENASGQVKRVAQRFGLVAAAGWLASAYGITGWSENEAFDAALNCLKAWLADRGGAGDREVQQILEQVAVFFQRDGEHRFSPWTGDSYHKTPHRAGYVKNDTGTPEFFVYPAVFKTDVCKGLDHKRVIRVLKDKGLLKTEGGKNTVGRRPGDKGLTVRFYQISGKVLDTLTDEV